MNILCLSIDGLHSGMIGAFGNSWIQTPALDSLAAQSVLFDRYYTDTLDLSAAFTALSHEGFFNEKLQLITEQSVSGQVALEHRRTFFITDDSDLYLHQYTDNFDERHHLEPFHDTQAAAVLDETQFCKAFAALTDIIDSINPDTEEFFVHLHLEGFRGCWDFPLHYRIRHQDAKDPPPYSKTVLPDFTDADPDTLQSVMEAYSGGMSVLDEALAGLLEYLDYLEDTALMFVSTRGFSLGEHRRIGANDDIYGENIHLPLMIRFPKCRFAGYRSQSLLLPQDVLPFLRTVSLKAAISDTEILDTAIPEEVEAVHSFLHIGNALVTPDWFYVPPELYVKPDDRWEVNNVAGRCQHVIEGHLRTLLTAK
ncbi:MAG: sulfatase-like hydrolase/transferase [Planctomycetaceae bacterium]|jgi:hypothetical protein|nr:sulfatase-like hydrolase/transferase [Planctomycetaceae bacterium]